MFDTNSDFLFIMTTVFYTKVYLALALTFVLLPSFQFIWFTHQKIKSLKAGDEKWLEMIGVWFRGQAFTLVDGYPHFLDKRVFIFDDINGNCGNFIVYVLTMLGCTVCQVCWSICYVIVHTIFYVLMFLSGYWLHSCKLNQNNKTNIRWYKWLLAEKAFHRFCGQIPPGEEINVEGSNSAEVGELFLETIPQACLVLVNAYFMQELTLIEYITMAGGAVMIINCMFKFSYWTLWMGVPLRYIPLSGRPKVEHINHSSFKTRVDNWLHGKKARAPVQTTDDLDIELQNRDDADAKQSATSTSTAMTTTTAQEVSSSAVVSISEELVNIARLRDVGILTEAEFNRASARMSMSTGSGPPGHCI
jgi:hypothetical protein